MEEKRVLFLGGAYAQIPIIEESKKRGWYVITCDYLPENPGHKLADEYYNVSTTDFEAVLEIAKKVKPDFIVAYASDPAAPTASYVSEKLGLPGNSFESIRILSEKDKFRKFLIDNKFNSPQIVSVLGQVDYYKIQSLKFPIIIKPTDSSGSKGVSRVDTLNDVDLAVQYALKFSRNKRVIAEEFIDNDNGDIHGDGFVYKGELIFSHLGDHIYNQNTNVYNPCGTVWPTEIKHEWLIYLESELKRLIRLSGFENGPINIEARINNRGDIYIMEIGPRSGGHFVPQAIKYGSGFDMVKATLDVYSESKVLVPENSGLHSAYYALHSDFEGVLKSVVISDKLKPYIKEFHQYVHPGDKVNSFKGANAALGVILLLFNTRDEMKEVISNMKELIKVIVE